MTRQILALCQKLAVILTQRQQQQQRDLWNIRVRDEKAFIPHGDRNRITEEEALLQNSAFGSFATACLKDVLRQTGSAERWERFYSHRKIVAVGWGRGHDSHWVREAALAGLQVLWLDVSDVALEWAWESLERQAREARDERIVVPGVNIVESELHTALMNPESIDLKLDEVSVWYACRVLGALIKRTVPEVLEIMGQSLSQERDSRKSNRIVLVQAFLEDNCEHQSRTSSLVRLGTVRRRLSKGAGRRVTVTTWGIYQYFGQKYRAIVAQAE